MYTRNQNDDGEWLVPLCVCMCSCLCMAFGWINVLIHRAFTKPKRWFIVLYFGMTFVSIDLFFTLLRYFAFSVYPPSDGASVRMAVMLGGMLSIRRTSVTDAIKDIRRRPNERIKSLNWYHRGNINCEWMMLCGVSCRRRKKRLIILTPSKWRAFAGEGERAAGML